MDKKGFQFSDDFYSGAVEWKCIVMECNHMRGCESMYCDDHRREIDYAMKMTNKEVFDKLGFC